MDSNSKICEYPDFRRIVYRHPKGLFIVIERCGKGKLGGQYRFRETIDMRRKQRKVKPKTKPDQTTVVAHVPDQDKARFAKLYRQGYSIRKIAKISGWSDTTVSNHLVRMGVIHRQKKVSVSYV